MRTYDEPKILSAYKRMGSIQSVATANNMSGKTVRAILIKNGIMVPPRGSRVFTIK